MNLHEHDIVLLNTSAGKDSQAMIDRVLRLADEQAYPKDRIHAVHADLGRVEWQGTRALAAEQASHYGVRFYVVRRPQGDLLQHVEARGKWPGYQTRYCTSEHKRNQILVLITKLVDEYRRATWGAGPHDKGVPKVRVLNCLGLRAEESSKRKAMPVTERNPNSNGKREITNWLPIHEMNEPQVWETIKRSGVRHHWAYDLGMPRLSCCFCFYAPKQALLIAGEHNPALLREYVRVEQKIGHTFKPDLSLIQISDALARGERGTATNMTWGQCA